MSRESGEHSLSILLVLSLWALEFWRSFMEVLRGRLCILLSILLRNQREGRRKCEVLFQHNDAIVVPDLQGTWETCGSGIQFCRAWQQCWWDVQRWPPSCSPLQAPARRRLAPPPGKVRTKMKGREGQVWWDNTTTHHIRYSFRDTPEQQQLWGKDRLHKKIN